jgi:hypothetical protein
VNDDLAPCHSICEFSGVLDFEINARRGFGGRRHLGFRWGYVRDYFVTASR